MLSVLWRRRDACGSQPSRARRSTVSDVLERAPLGIHREEDRDDSGSDHQAGTEQVAVVDVRFAVRSNQRTEDGRRECRDSRSDGVEESDSHGACLEREELADREVGGTRSG